MKVSDELRKRLKFLEEEQERQEKELVDLDNLRDLATIAELETELKRLEKEGFKQDAAAKKTAKDVDLEKEKKLLEEGEKAQKEMAAPAPQPQPTFKLELAEEFLLDTEEKPQKAVAKGGFAICLMFNEESPTEWSEESGGGWRGRGLGARYPTQKEAERVLQQLKQKWPDYPLKILKF